MAYGCVGAAEVGVGGPFESCLAGNSCLLWSCLICTGVEGVGLRWLSR